LLRGGSKFDWSFKKLFGRSIKSACPLATASNVYVDISSNKSGSEFTVSPAFSTITRQVTQQHQQHFAMYDVKQMINPSGSEETLNVVFKWKKRATQGY